MTTDRPYRRALSRERAIQEITKNAGSQFDPEVVEVFLSAMEGRAFKYLSKGKYTHI